MAEEADGVSVPGGKPSRLVEPVSSSVVVVKGFPPPHADSADAAASPSQKRLICLYLNIFIVLRYLRAAAVGKVN